MAAVNAVGRAAGVEPLAPLEQLDGDARVRDLYERHATRVLAYCRSRLRRREDAEDAVQTTFLHAVNNLRRGDRPSHELAWLLGIARNVCLSRLETAGRRGRLELVCDPVDLERSEAPNGRRDELIGLEDALARLPELQRRAVLLRDWRGLSYEEVASQLGVSLANAETLIFRGRRSLAALLDEQPAATRRRLASLGSTGLGNTASLLGWAKATFGGVTAAKLAAAAVAVAVSGAGVAAGTGALDRGKAAPTRTPEQHAPAPAAATPGPRAGAAGAAGRASTSAPAGPARAATAPATPRSRVTPTPTPPAPTPVPAGQAPSPSGPAPEQRPVPGRAAPGAQSPAEGVSATVERAVPPLAPVTAAVTETVVAVVDAARVPDLPVEAPPVVETVVEAVPPVTAGPITVDPPKLLP